MLIISWTSDRCWESSSKEMDDPKCHKLVKYQGIRSDSRRGPCCECALNCSETALSNATFIHRRSIVKALTDLQVLPRRIRKYLSTISNSIIRLSFLTHRSPACIWAFMWAWVQWKLTVFVDARGTWSLCSARSCE